MNAAGRSKLWRDSRVFLTGHTGFKGSWLSLWLKQWQAQLYGYSLAPQSPSLFEQANLTQEIPGEFSDIRDAVKLTAAMQGHKPEIVFHLAAQPLVRESYADPVTTYATNIMGTINLLEAVRQTPSVKAVVIVTSDKCYENVERKEPYVETDKLGGHDPYSSSKACAEIVSAAYRSSYFTDKSLLLATARAGNVIGGGDWSKDRLIPDAIRAFSKNEPLIIRYPDATRPWQHVLEALNGYLVLGEGLLAGKKDYAQGWNFGPKPEDFRSVKDVVERIIELWGDRAAWKADSTKTWHEAELLALDINKALKTLPWKPKLTLDESLKDTISWYKQSHSQADMLDYTNQQISAYTSKL